MSIRSLLCTLLAAGGLAAQIRTGVDEVMVDVVVRDRRGRALKDITAAEIEVYDNGVKREIRSMRLVQGTDPVRDVRLVTLAFNPLSPDGRRLARQAALDIVREPAGNVYFAVMMLGQQLNALQEFTTDREKLKAAIEKATSGANFLQMAADSHRIREQLRGVAAKGGDTVDVKLAEVLLRTLEFEASVTSDERTRALANSIMAIARGQLLMMGRKSVVFFSEGLSVPPQLQPAFDAAVAAANRANVAFYAIDARGLLSQGQNAVGDLTEAATASRDTIATSERFITKDEIRAQERGENSMRQNLQAALATLSDSTGGFLVANTNDLRGPLRRVAEEVNNYYEVTYAPAIENYDGSFRGISVKVARPDARVQARSGYFALPPMEGGHMMLPFELPLIKALDTTPVPRNLEFRSAALHLEPGRAGSGTASLLVEVPMKNAQFAVDQAASSYRAQLSLLALIRDANGAIVTKLSREVPVSGPLARLEAVREANFIFREQVKLAPGRYTVATAVMDRESGKIGGRKAVFVMQQKPQGVRLSSVALVRRYEPNAQNLDPQEPYQFQGGRITPTLASSITGGKGASLSLFFIVYPDAAIAQKPAVAVEYLVDGKAVARADLDLPAPDAQGRIPYVMSSPAENMKPGMYEIRVVVRQGSSAAEERTFVTIE
jgi:VWFA-related protein